MQIALSQSEKDSYRWVIVAANFVVMIAIWSPYAAYGVFLPRLAEDLNWQRGAVGLTLSIVLILGAPLGLAVGKIIDRYGPQKLMVFEVIVGSLAFLLASRTEELWHLYLFLGIMQGFAFAGAYIIPTATTARWFDKNRGLALSIVMSAIGLAYIVGPLLTVKLMEDYGWRSTLVIYGVGIAALGIVPALVLRNPPTAARGEGAARVDAPRPGAQGPGPSAPVVTLKGALVTSTFWMLLFVWLFQSFAQMMLVLHLVPMEADKGIGLAAAAGALGSYGVGVLAGRVFSGPTADHIGAEGVGAVTMVMAALALVLVLVTHDLTLLYSATFVFGVALAGADTAFVRVLPDVVGNSALGSLMSGFSFGWRVGGAMGPAFAGFLFDATRLYALPFSVAIVGLLLSGGLFVAATRPERKLEPLLAKRG